MQKILCALAAVLLASCSSDWSAGLADHRANSSASPQGQHSAPANPLAASAPMRARSFANAPDRGSLVQYPKNPVVRRSGAYTWHAAALSEDHALKSTVTGDLSFTAPDGTAISLKYERHVEHPDGNWSWIGRGSDERAESTVITFGEDAAFGTIPQRDGLPLRLTVGAGRAWVVSTDPRLLRDVHNEATDPTGPDYLVPPKLAAASTASGMEAMGAEAASTTASGKTVVDVLVGFTDGYSGYLGGASAALTRIHNLVDITNQAYVNSKVEAEVRLVHAMQIGYPDATANKTALEELTGFKAPSTRTTPAAAFSGLRSARDQYGADLVVLLRRFQDPENDGCGIAWLIGGGQSGIDSSDEFFGYSVVSDGQDTGTDGKTYFCRDETFAHELGHNMGSQHDSDNAKKDDGSQSYGVYSYSFGYKTSATNGDFHTVMAYGDKGQTRNRVFSNPNVSICGIDANLVCGVADKADNARSLGQTAPIVAKFRATVAFSSPPAASRAKNDFDGDGKSDLLWYHSIMQRIAYWIVSGNEIIRHGGQASGGDYRVLTSGDYDGDGRVDMIWLGPQGDLQMWFSDGVGFVWKPLAQHPEGWTLIASADMNGDGRDDLLWYHPGIQSIRYWIMGGNTVMQQGEQLSGGGYRVLTTGDYNGDGRVDLIWIGPSGDLQMWFSDGNGFFWMPLVQYPGGWNLVASADMDGDGKSDLLWYHPTMQRIAYWVMDGNNIIRHGGQSSGGEYAVLTTGDYNGDGRVDIIWRGPQGDLQMWFSDGVGFVWRPFVQFPDGWTLLP